MELTNGVKAWHFLLDNYKTHYGSFRQKKIEAGTYLKVKGEPCLCYWGLHASKYVTDALKYAYGSVLCRVVVGGKVIFGKDKFVGTERYVEWTLDASGVLNEFICRCAEREARLLKNDKTISNFILDCVKLRRDWLNGECEYEKLVAKINSRCDRYRLFNLFRPLGCFNAYIYASMINEFCKYDSCRPNSRRNQERIFMNILDKVSWES